MTKAVLDLKVCVVLAAVASALAIASLSMRVCSTGPTVHRPTAIERQVEDACEHAKSRAIIALERLRGWERRTESSEDAVSAREGIAQTWELSEWMGLCGMADAGRRMLSAMPLGADPDVPALRKLLEEFRERPRGVEADPRYSSR